MKNKINVQELITLIVTLAIITPIVPIIFGVLKMDTRFNIFTGVYIAISLILFFCTREKELPISQNLKSLPLCMVFAGIPTLIVCFIIEGIFYDRLLLLKGVWFLTLMVSIYLIVMGGLKLIDWLSRKNSF